MAESEASTFSLIEEGGVTLELRERALPYRPLTISGKQRAEFTWYPGNPEATVQMLGPEEGVISLRGYWKDRFIQGTGAAQLYNSGEFLLGQLPGYLAASRNVGTVADLVQAVDDMRRMGRRITLSWAGLQRVGHITSFTQHWNNVHDCEWEMDFSVLSQNESVVPTAQQNSPNLADQAVQALQDAQNVADNLLEQTTVLANASLTWTNLFATASTQFDNLTSTAASAIYNATSSVASYEQAPFDAARRIAASASGLVVSASQTLGTVVDRALSDYVEFGAWGTQDDAPMGIQIAGNSVQRSFNNAVQSVRYNNALTRYSLEQQLQQELLASFVAAQNMDLRDVSTRYYGTPDNWQQLMQFNGFASSKLNAGDLVWVPKQGNNGGPAGFASSRSY
jgi:hypothetical protein